MEDTQNSAQGQPTTHEVTKLPSTSRRQDTQSVTKRYGFPRSYHQRLHLSPTNIFPSLQTELMQLMLSTTPGISAFPSSPENLLNWTATIAGPSDTPYASLTFKLSFQFPSTYPYAPPTVLFKTPIFHPNVDFSGRICLDILKDKWSAVYNVQSVLLSLQSLLGEPNKYVVPTSFISVH